MEDYLKDVAGSSPEAQEDHYEEPSPEADADQPEGDEDQGGRTIENVYRELSRKQEEFQERMFQQLTESQKLLADAVQTRTEQPEQKSGNTFDDMSLDQLEQFRNDVQENNPEYLAQFDSYLQRRRVDETVEQRLQQYRQRDQMDARRKQSNETAVQRYPELGQPNSSFYRTVNSRLQEMGREWVESNPRAVLDAANDVAVEMGVTPNTHRPAIRGTMANRDMGGGAPVGRAEEKKELPKSGQSAEDRAAIADRLRAALPSGKNFSKDKDIEDKMASYHRNISLFTRG